MPALEPGAAHEAARLAGTLRDPARCQIVRTATHLGVPLVTRNKRSLEKVQPLGIEVLEA